MTMEFAQCDATPFASFSWYDFEPFEEQSMIMNGNNLWTGVGRTLSIRWSPSASFGTFGEELGYGI